ncbi:MAG TPA: ferritin [Cyclobacteriaceae bacterium]|nr:ferritin [Cyclobacteriaceae bacterium]
MSTNTSVIRLKTSLQENIAELLNRQIAMESQSSANYLAMASWCYTQGLNGSGDFFKKQSAEERGHMLKIFDYMIDAGAQPTVPEVTKIEHHFEGLRDVLTKALEQEISVTHSFNNIVDNCHKTKDFVTNKFLQWFLEEQLEEEQTARRCLELFDIIGTEDGGLFRIDKEIIRLKSEDMTKHVPKTV